MRKFDASLFVAMLIVFPLGIYKSFYEKGSVLSTSYGILLLGLALYLLFILIKQFKSSKKDH
jgi:hypothetical protein